ncbi:MAG: D12 class N6 adenine-specific DNA methyltransferase [Bacteroidetes bacterium ADurb.Bin408]|nr:MAG: D12 class N6 adenine-specific DNA methyltransferase [Bacteroidetes bacterium ADurb.Bin408]
MGEQLSIFRQSEVKKQQIKVVNVSSVPQRSPFRYPGGKTWLIPTVRDWLRQENSKKELIEPFVGGGIVSLTAAFENLADHITMVELDEEIASVWEVILNGKNEWLADKILSFELTYENVNKELNNPNKNTRDLAFCTILKNRVFHGGIIAKGSGMLKHGENGKGIASRWYAKTLANRIRVINIIKHKIQFLHTDAFKIIEEKSKNKNSYFFIDPPYTVAGKRLYTYFEIDHEKLFYLTSKIQGKFMLTYDDTNEIRALANKYQLDFRTIPMKTTHHLEKNEIIISDNFDWWKEQ